MTVILISPSESPKQVISFSKLVVIDISLGSVITTCCTFWHPLASVTVKLYIPAANPAAFSVVFTFAVSHKKLNGNVPPETVTATEPLLAPKQFTLVCDAIAVIIPFGSVIVTCCTTEQLLASVTVTL